MRKSAVLLLFIAALITLEGTAIAGVVGSPHDIAAQRYAMNGKDEKKRNVCNYCHVPHKAKGARLWALVPPSLKGWGTVGPLCYSCHDGVTIVSSNVDASNTAFNPKSHGLNLKEIPEGDDPSASGFPYSSGGSESGNMECSTCHNPHDDTNRPFLRAAINEICEKCHVNRMNSGIGINNAEGTHPVHINPADETGNASPIDVQEDFKTPFPQDYPAEGGRDAVGVHWILGGHLASGRDGTVECTTCHAVHGREGTGPVADKLLAIDPVLDYANLFCEGCHRGDRADGLSQPPFPNPGGTKFYHPVDNDQCNGPGRKLEIDEPEGWQFGKGGELLCTTCHKPHGGLKDSPLLRPMTKSDTFCEECHVTPPPSHHATGAPSMAVSSNVKSVRTREVTIPADFPAGLSFGKPVPGMIYCSTCHGAHNLKCKSLLVNVDCGQAGVGGIGGGNGPDQCAICTKCHPKNNPTWQTDDNYKASHFMGDPTAEIVDLPDVNGNVGGTQPGYYDQYPPENTEAWPETNRKSVYGGQGGKDVTCCSCHTFGVSGITAGDADQSPYLGPQLAPGMQESDLTKGLLARAGQYKEWQDSDVTKHDVGGDRGSENRVDKYLCTGCHGLTPNSHPTNDNGEGLTHPLMDADGTKFPPDPPAKPEEPPVRLTYSKHINCETCHKPHEADSRGGYFVLRNVELKFGSSSSTSGTPSPYTIRKLTDIEFAPLCRKCHKEY